MATKHEWDLRWLKMAKEVASWSKDDSTQCGCVIVSQQNKIVTLGYNGLPRDIDYDDTSLWQERPEKYFWMEHAERNAVYNAERSMQGCVAYVTGPPCMDCGRALKQVGVIRVVVPMHHNMGLGSDYIERWRESCQRAEKLFRLAGVVYEFVEEGPDGESSS